LAEPIGGTCDENACHDSFGFVLRIAPQPVFEDAAESRKIT
jgi:hypothetical protein